MKAVINIKILFLSILTCGLLAQSQELDSLAYSIDLDDVVITGQYAPTHYTKALHNVSVIKKEEFQNRGFTQLDQVLKFNSSVRIDHDPILGSVVRLRGVDNKNVAILVDGVPVIGRFDFAIDLSQISLTNIERIEIVEGPQSLIYGNNAAGGVINLISKKSQVPKLRATLSNQIESTKLRNHELTLGTNLGPLFISAYGRYVDDQYQPDDSLRVYETREFEDGTSETSKKYPWNPKEQINGGVSMRYNFADDHNVILRYDRSNQNVRTLGELRRPSFKPYAFDRRYETNRSDASIHYNHKLSDSYLLNFTGSYNHYLRHLNNERFEFEENAINEESTTIDTSHFNAYFSKLTLASSYNKHLDFLVGLQYNFEQGKGERIEIPENKEFASNEFISVFGDVKYKLLYNLQGSIGGRYTAHSGFNNNFSPTFQMKWSPKPHMHLRGGYARGYRSPELKELWLDFIDVSHFVLGNENLKPELLNDFNLSFEYQGKTRKFDFTAAMKLYRSDISQKIILVQFEPAKFLYENLDEYSVQGIGTDLSLQVKNISFNNAINLGYWFNNFSSYTDSPKYNQTLDVSNGIRVSFLKDDLNLMVNHRFIGELPQYYMDNEQTVQLSVTEGYNLLDMSMSYSLFKNSVRISGGVRNIFNIQNTNTLNQDTGSNHAFNTNSTSQLVSKGRTFFVGLSMEFCK